MKYALVQALIVQKVLPKPIPLPLFSTLNFFWFINFTTITTMTVSYEAC